MANCYIQITIDTQRIKQNFPKGTGTPTSPKPIDHTYGYMVVEGATKVNNFTSGQREGLSTQGTGDLSFNTTDEGEVRFFATSGSHGYNDAVLVYGIERYAGDSVLGDFRSVQVYRSTMLPSEGNSVLPGSSTKIPFWFYEADIADTGTEQYKVNIALYNRDDSGILQPYGYFCWDPTITITG